MKYRNRYSELFRQRMDLEEQFRQRQTNMQYELDCMRKLELQLQRNESDINDLIVELMEEVDEGKQTIERLETEYEDLKYYGGRLIQ